MSSTTIPSLFAAGSPSGDAAAAPSLQREARDLVDLLYEGYYMVFLLRNGWGPSGAEDFRARLRAFLARFERGTVRLDTPAADVRLAKFAFCALVDEIVMASSLPIRSEWERKPLQLELFGDQLAGERFFEHLEQLRGAGASRLQVLEVFHMCLLLGFQGRYVLEGSEKLDYLTARLGDEIAQLRGRRAAFAPHWAAPDKVLHRLRTEVPLWAIVSVFMLLALLAYLGMATLLHRQTEQDLSAYDGVIKVAPQTANVLITLP